MGPGPIRGSLRVFSDEKSLEAITPAWLRFRVTGKSTPKIQAGTLIDYRLSLRGIPVRWQSRIERWQPNESFIDTQVKGPYSYWHHTHQFETVGKGTLMRDTVAYSIPGGSLSGLLAPFI